MRILSMKPGHDGSIALVEDGRLVYSLEAEKNSFPRYSPITPSVLSEAASMCAGPPDVVAIGGWHKSLPGCDSQLAAGYLGIGAVEVTTGEFFGAGVRVFSSSHERSHIFMAATMAPGAPLQECAVLVWEGVIGAFYHWRDFGRTITRHHVLGEPGTRYAALFALADPTFSDAAPEPRLEDAGKLMALSAYGTPSDLRPDERKTVESLLQADTMYPFDKTAYRDSPLYNCGLKSPVLHRTARFLTDQLFEVFHAAAAAWAPRDVPLVISGGCGLNCEWNKRWVESGLFSDVFVPPCANDSGSAIGTAMDAAVHFGEPARVEWNVYSGAPFVAGEPDAGKWSRRPLDSRDLARCLRDGSVVAWIQGRCEIGPRALGHRSLLASPLDGRNRDVLNGIKQREDYRPIAPCCRYEELEDWFEEAVEDPYMLYFSKVKTTELPAVTHVDGTARIQSVRPSQEPALHDLLTAFRAETGYGVLCNTSLNYPGHGFINSVAELMEYCESKDIREVVVGSDWYRRI